MSTTVDGAARSGPALRYGEPDRVTPDPGLFGPGSATWAIHGDPIGGVAGIRALLLQALDPGSMAGVARFSDYRSDPWGRLFRTAEYVGVTTFGTTAEAEGAATIVRDVHARLGLDDPDLLLWVHVAFVDSMLSTHRRSGAPLAAADVDRYVREQVTAARLVGLPPADVPATAREIADYLAARRPRLHAIDEAVAAARFILVPPMSPRVRWTTPAQPAWGLLAGTGFAALPRWARRMYGDGLGPAGRVAAPFLAGVPRAADLHATLSLRAVRRALLALPESWREGPHVGAAMERLGLGGQDQLR